MYAFEAAAHLKAFRHLYPLALQIFRQLVCIFILFQIDAPSIDRNVDIKRQDKGVHDSQTCQHRRKGLGID
jgi:hypothetical protein